MIAYYLDSSVAMRFLFQQPDGFIFPEEGIFVSSTLLRVECFRALDRIYQLRQRTAQQVLSARTSFHVLIETMKMIDLNKITLERACQSFGFPIKTLDAIHLSTALLYKEEFETPLVMLTHDVQLGRAARAMNFEVQGCNCEF